MNVSDKTIIKTMSLNNADNKSLLSQDRHRRNSGAKFVFLSTIQHAVANFAINISINYIGNMQNGRNTAGQFSAGNTGRPKGSRNKATLAIESLLQGQAEALTQTAVTKALEGDSVALRLCMERIAPAPRDNTVSFSLSKIKNALDASEAAGSVLNAVSDGDLTPIEAVRVMGLIDSYRRTLELTEIEERLQKLEAS